MRVVNEVIIITLQSVQEGCVCGHTRGPQPLQREQPAIRAKALPGMKAHFLVLRIFAGAEPFCFRSHRTWTSPPPCTQVTATNIAGRQVFWQQGTLCAGCRRAMYHGSRFGPKCRAVAQKRLTRRNGSFLPRQAMSTGCVRLSPGSRLFRKRAGRPRLRGGADQSFVWPAAPQTEQPDVGSQHGAWTNS